MAGLIEHSAKANSILFSDLIKKKRFSFLNYINMNEIILFIINIIYPSFQSSQCYE